MNHTPTRQSRLLMIFLLTLITSGCGGTQRPVIYYNLSQAELEHRQETGTKNKNFALGIGPIQFPESLSRIQIVSRLDNQRLTYSDSNRWSGPLHDSFASVLMEDIAAQLPEQTPTALFPWAKYFQPSHRLLVDVSQFDGQLGGEVILIARWTITNGDGKTALFSQKSTVRVKTNGAQYQDLVSAQSQAVANLSQEIITALASL